MKQGQLVYNNSTKESDTKCQQTFNNNMNKKMSNYAFTPCIKNNINNAKNISLSQPMININSNFGWCGERGNKIDDDSQLRNGSHMITKRDYKNSQNISYFNSPNLSRGPINTCVESILRPGEDVSQRQPCNSFAGADMTERNFLPLIENLKDLQCTNHIIQEDSYNNWKRGGNNSREMLRQPDVLSKMGYIHNGKYWQKNKL